MTKLIVSQLPFSITESDIRDVFSPFGELTQVTLPLDVTTQAPMGIAHVTFAEGEHAAAEAGSAQEEEGTEGGGEGSQVKEQRVVWRFSARDCAWWRGCCRGRPR